MSEGLVSLLVGEADYAQRLDVFLTNRMPWRSRKSLVELLEAGRITVNGSKVKKAHRLLLGDRVDLELPRAAPDTTVGEIVLAILYEDDDLVVIDKIANLSVHPASTCMQRNLLTRLEHRYRHEVPDPQVQPSIIHRLDRGTSGVIAVAKKRELVAFYAAQFERRTTTKEYLALVHGSAPDGGRIEHPILAVPQRPVSIDPAGKPSRTDFQCLRRNHELSLVHIRLHTGRKHQIRAHFAAEGHPLVYDDIYGAPARAEWPPDAAPMLHAARLTLEHRQHGRLTFEAPLPPRFEIAWRALRG